LKIAIPVDDQHLTSGVCVSFGRAPYFLIYDSETQEAIYLDNSAQSSSGGAGIKAAQILVDQKITALLTPRCGENAMEVLNAAEINVYKTESLDIKQSLESFKINALSPLVEVHVGLHHHGGQ